MTGLYFTYLNNLVDKDINVAKDAKLTFFYSYANNLPYTNVRKLLYFHFYNEA